MDGATNFMSDTLNDVLSMDKIEEGKGSYKLTESVMIRSSCQFLRDGDTLTLYFTRRKRRTRIAIILTSHI